MTGIRDCGCDRRASWCACDQRDGGQGEGGHGVGDGLCAAAENGCGASLMRRAAPHRACGRVERGALLYLGLITHTARSPAHRGEDGPLAHSSRVRRPSSASPRGRGARFARGRGAQFARCRSYYAAERFPLWFPYVFVVASCAACVSCRVVSRHTCVDRGLGQRRVTSRDARLPVYLRTLDIFITQSMVFDT